MYLKYAQAFNASEEAEFWITHNLANFLKTNPENQDEIEHIIDYLVSDDAPKRLKSMSYDEAKKNAEKWTKSQQKKGNKIQEAESDTEVVLDFKDGFKIVKLIGKAAYEREGYLMRHCVASYFGRDAEIYSLRDKDNNPHATMEKDQQIKGKGNGDIHPKYINYVVQFLEYTGMTVGDNEMKHLGYVNMERFKKELHKDTKYFNKVYLPADERLIGKDGKEFASLDLWDIRPLVSEQNESLKINFELPSFIKLSFEYMRSKITKLSSSDNITDNGHSTKIGASGDYTKIGASGDYTQIGASGDSTKIGASGDSTQIGASGDSTQIGASGHSTKIGASGDYTKIGASGDYTKIGASGHSTKIGASGDSTQIGASGDSTQIGASGDYTKIGASGDYTQIDMTGEYSVGLIAGHNGKAKGKIGSWFCLSEWKKDTDGIWKPVCVKAIQIDGKTIKEDTWYKLVNGEFEEVT